MIVYHLSYQATNGRRSGRHAGCCCPASKDEEVGWAIWGMALWELPNDVPRPWDSRRVGQIERLNGSQSNNRRQRMVCRRQTKVFVVPFA